MGSMTRDPLGCGDCPVRDLAVCAGLSDAERRDLAALGVRRRYRRGETIFAAGDESIACATLISGAVKLSRHDVEGVERSVALLHAASFLARLFAAEIDSSVTAIADSELCVFPRRAIERRMGDHPGFMERVLRATAEQLASAHDLIDLIGRRNAAARLAGLLLLFAQGGCNGAPLDGTLIELPLTRGEMASLLGLTIETVSRQLSAMEAAGTIERQGQRGIRVKSLDALRSVAG